MSVLIKGMEMPDDGYVCLKVFANGDVMMNKVHRGALVITGIKDKVGTAVPVPPHGRLGDLDRLEKELAFDYAYAAADICKAAPTIIEAEEATQKDGGQDETPAGPYDLLYEEGGPDA